MRKCSKVIQKTKRSAYYYSLGIFHLLASLLRNPCGRNNVSVLDRLLYGDALLSEYRSTVCESVRPIEHRVVVQRQLADTADARPSPSLVLATDQPSRPYTFRSTSLDRLTSSVCVLTVHDSATTLTSLHKTMTSYTQKYKNNNY